MRFITAYFKIPEIDKYSEEEFENLVRQAKLRRGDAVWVIPMGVGLLAVGAWVGVCVLLTMGITTAAGGGSGASAGGGAGISRAVLGGWGLANAFVALLVFIATVVAMRWMLLVRSIRRLINKAGCPYCEFSLVGLPVKHGMVVCPECGQRVFLHEHRLTEDDLVTDQERIARVRKIGAGVMGSYQERPKRAARR